MTGLTADGAELVDQCFGARAGTPLVRINAYGTDSQTSEHRGFVNCSRAPSACSATRRRTHPEPPPDGR